MAIDRKYETKNKRKIIPHTYIFTRNLFRITVIMLNAYNAASKALSAVNARKATISPPPVPLVLGGVVKNFSDF